MSNLCYLNGNVLSLDEACISINDRGVLYGDGLFETVRIYNGMPFLIEEHLQRMREGALALHISLPGTLLEMKEAVDEILAANEVREGLMRLTLTRGTNVRGIWPETNSNSTFFITTNPSVPYTPEQYRQGIKASFMSFPLNENSPQVGFKTLNYLDNILGRREAYYKGVDEGIFLNLKGYLVEGTASNLFVIKNNVLFTPPPESGLLPGITRAVVLKLASKTYGVEEQNLSPAFLKGADEAFLTNSLMEIMPLVKIDEDIIGSGFVGAITVNLHRTYQEYIKSNLA